MIELANIIVDTQNSLKLFLPELIIVIFLLLAIVSDLIFRKIKFFNGYLSIIAFILSGMFLLLIPTNQLAFQNTYVIDNFGIFFKIIVLISNLLVVIMSFVSKELREASQNLGEFYVFLLGMTFGMFLLVGATNLILIYLAIETMSISSYILAGYTKEIKRASEASLKYVIFGAVSSGLMIYGISLLFGLTGSLNIYNINSYLSSNGIETFPFFIATLFIFAGFAYKISAVPFHFWTPDVYEGSPITVTAYLSVASKSAGFAALIRFLVSTFIENTPGFNQIFTLASQISWGNIIAIFSALTMTIGNIVALWQNNLKRLLAYSSIAHAGYILMGVAVMTQTGIASVLLYVFVYMIMNLGAFICVMLVANELNSEEISEFEGLGYRMPLLSALFSILLFSLIGLPPTAGFIAKFYVFAAVIDAGLIWLAVVGVLNSVISLYYYVKIMRNLYIRGIDSNHSSISVTKLGLGLTFILAFFTLLFGIYFSPLLNWANLSSNIFLGN
ncbi:MAG: NADH-quinone oxidoreductase subunit N [Candidatus Kapaibacteriales bacterium]